MTYVEGTRLRRTPDGRELLWLTLAAPDGRPVRRTLVEKATGEILDDVWLDEAGWVRSAAARPREASSSRARRAERRSERVALPAKAAQAGRPSKVEQLALDAPDQSTPVRVWMIGATVCHGIGQVRPLADAAAAVDAMRGTPGLQIVQQLRPVEIRSERGRAA